ncbi:MAG: hypothetical protein V1664_04820 [Candidatus Uhrbacteria bacterium]
MNRYCFLLLVAVFSFIAATVLSSKAMAETTYILDTTAFYVQWSDEQQNPTVVPLGFARSLTTKLLGCYSLDPVEGTQIEGRNSWRFDVAGLGEITVTKTGHSSNTGQIEFSVVLNRNGKSKAVEKRSGGTC